MKRYCNLFLLFLFPVLMLANNPKLNGKYTKEKKIEKQFDVTPNTLLHIDNRYGNVDITTWNQNRIEIEITMTTNGNNEEEVANRLDDISVAFNTSSNHVSAVTQISNKRSGWSFWRNTSSNVNMKINYTLKMPLSNNLEIKNDYGAINLNELNGNLSLSCDYGSFIIGNLNGENNQLLFDYTKNATIAYVKQAHIQADYSDFSIEKAHSIDYKGDYSKALFHQILTKLHFNADYGKLTVGQATQVKGKSSYLPTTFDAISHQLELDASYGKITLGSLAESFKKVAIQAEYTSVTIDFNSQAAFDFFVNLSYAGFKASPEFNYFLKDVQNSSRTFKGYYGAKNSGNIIEISSSYGGVNIQKL